jgi:hypothetical protein
MADKVLVGDDCWEWTGARTTAGYGNVSPGNKQTVLSHRVMYELLVDPIPDGLELDHLCRNRACVRPAHLEPVTHQENCRRGAGGPKSHCKHGHPWDEANTWIRKEGTRECRTCRRVALRRHAARRKAA